MPGFPKEICRCDCMQQDQFSFNRWLVTVKMFLDSQLEHRDVFVDGDALNVEISIVMVAATILATGSATWKRNAKFFWLADVPSHFQSSLKKCTWGHNSGTHLTHFLQPFSGAGAGAATAGLLFSFTSLYMLISQNCCCRRCTRCCSRCSLQGVSLKHQMKSYSVGWLADTASVGKKGSICSLLSVIPTLLHPRTGSAAVEVEGGCASFGLCLGALAFHVLLLCVFKL